MPVTVSYPGVYVQEIPSTSHSVVNATTSATAFVGWFPRGAVDGAVHIANMTQFQREFGGLHLKSEASYAISQYFTNGGTDAWVVRLPTANAAPATFPIAIERPDPAELIANAAQQLDDAWTHAQAAWQAVYGIPAPGAGGSPPDSPPISFDSPPMASGDHDTSAESADEQTKDLANIGQIAQGAGKAAVAATDALIQAALLVDDVALLVGAIFAKTDPGLFHATWRTAELAAADAVDAVALMQRALERANDLSDDVADGHPKPQLPDQILHMNNASDAIAAARTAAITAASRAEEAIAAGADAAAAAAGPQLLVSAANPGAWGNCLRVYIKSNPGGTFGLIVNEVALQRGRWVTVSAETYPVLSLNEGAINNAAAVVNDQSSLISLKVQGTIVPDLSHPVANPGPINAFASWYALAGGVDGAQPTTADLDPSAKVAVPSPGGTWLQKLKNIAPSVFNILCIPDTINMAANDAKTIFVAANNFCEASHSIFLFDIPAEKTKNLATLPAWLSANGFANEEAYSSATYVPTLKMPDPLAGYRDREVGPSGTMAGVFARTDAARGVWKAPAGVAAVLLNADLSAKIDDDINGDLNQNGVNVLRTFPNYGAIAWGARTLAGADLLDSEWKYINVRRLVDYIEQSLFQSLKWVVFEPNTETTWSQIRLEVGSFLSGLFTAGAFSGATADKSFFVRCDATTTTEADIDRGVVNIMIGVAPDKPAEFVVLQIQQIAAQAAA